MRNWLFKLGAHAQTNEVCAIKWQNVFNAKCGDIFAICFKYFWDTHVYQEEKTIMFFYEYSVIECKRSRVIYYYVCVQVKLHRPAS